MQSITSDTLDRSSYSQDGEPPSLQRLPATKKSFRPKLSCNQCRTRKVKCDKVRPCSACCSRGKPDECVFPADANHKAIDQSQEIKILRKRVKDLENENSQLRSSGDIRYIYGHSVDSAPGPGIPKLPVAQSRPPICRRVSGQTSLYNAPSASRTMRDGSNFSDTECLDPRFDQADPRNERLPIEHGWPASLAYPVLRQVDVDNFQDAPADPFPSLWLSTGGASGILHVLPPQEDILLYQEFFREHVLPLLTIPYRMAQGYNDQFLIDIRGNAEKNPQMLAFLFVSLALCVHLGVGKKHERSIQGAAKKELFSGDIYLAAAMHALRLSSFTNRPTILCVQTLLMMGSYLVNIGKFLDAYTLFGTTIRVAQGMGLHQHPASLNPPPSTEECHFRQKLWCLMLFLDVYYSQALGRPLGVSSIGSVSLQPEFTQSGANPTTGHQLEIHMNRYSVLCRQIISCDYLTDARIDGFTDSLVRYRDSLPSTTKFDRSWLCPDNESPQWPSNIHAAIFHGNIHTYLISLNRRRREVGSRRPSQAGIRMTPEKSPERGYARVISSCHEILFAFSLVYQQVPAGLVFWMIGQQALNAAMILSLNILETHDFTDIRAVAAARDIFIEMQNKENCRTAKPAVSRLNSMLEAMEGNGPLPEERVMGNYGMILVEDPEIRTVGDWNNPMDFRLTNDTPPGPTIDDSRSSVAPPNAAPHRVEKKKHVKKEKLGRDRLVGRSEYTPPPRYTDPRINEPPVMTGYDKNETAAMSFPAPFSQPESERLQYNSYPEDLQEMLHMAPYDRDPSFASAISTMGAQHGLQKAYADRSPAYHYQPPMSYPASNAEDTKYVYPRG